MMEDEDNHDTDPSEVEDEREKNSNDTDGSDDIAEENQTRFLLGLTTAETADAMATNNAMAEGSLSRQGGNKASGTAESPIEVSS